MADTFGIRPPAYRLPESTRIGRVRLQVADLGRSIDYYTRLLGLTLAWQEGSRAGLAAGAAPMPLVELSERPGAMPVPRGGLLGLYHVAILLPDRAALGRFVAHLAKAGVHAASADHAVSEAIYLWDPDGLGLEVYADRPRAAWRSDHGGQLFMTTAPLDGRGLLAAGAGAPWDGMPGGTIVGHIHLHVDSLERAGAFYHHALGLDKTVWTYPGALFLAAGGYHHHLGTNTWASGPPASDRHARLLSWDLLVPGAADRDAAAASLAGAGNRVETVGGVCEVSDPWDTRLRIVAAGS